MKLVILFVLFSGAMAQTGEEPWTQLGNKEFAFFPTRRTWSTAQLYCLRVGGHLAVITNDAEDAFVKELGRQQKTWIGLVNVEKDDWLWINSEPKSFTKWCSGEPNNAGGNENCAITNHSDKKCWNDYHCEKQYPYVCERDLH